MPSDHLTNALISDLLAACFPKKTPPIRVLQLTRWDYIDAASDFIQNMYKTYFHFVRLADYSTEDNEGELKDDTFVPSTAE